MQLYGYWRSTASYRVRIALALKGVNIEAAPINLAKDGGEQRQPAYRAINPQGRVPALELGRGIVLTQSSAIIEYLEEVYPEPPLLPNDQVLRARVRAVASIIACDIHPLHNLAPLTYLRSTLNVPEIDVTLWIQHWIADGLAAVESLIDGPLFAFGTAPSLADVYIVPQIYAAHRFGVDLSGFTKIKKLENASADHPAFQSSHPSNQADAPINKG